MTDKQLLKVKKYTESVLKNSTDPQHTFEHVDRVRKNALKIVKLLQIKNIDLNLLQAACYLHDVPGAMFKHGPAIRHFFENIAVNNYLPGILKELKVNEEESEILTEAISKHTFTIPYKRLNRNGGMYLKIMQDADSMGFLSYEREKSFLIHRKKHISYFVVSLIAGKYLRYARKNLAQFLNFPEVAKYNWFT